MDYDLDSHTQSPVKSLAGVLPLFVELANDHQAVHIAKTIAADFLKVGGLVTTNIQSTQQWDSPNGWAPLQWFAVKGLLNYGQQALAKKIMLRWLDTVDRHFEQTGKLMEKYNVCDQTRTAGGGEYDVQEGFGWTNGVYQAFLKELAQITESF
jgi:alpha,alpha-trehalase